MGVRKQAEHQHSARVGSTKTKLHFNTGGRALRGNKEYLWFYKETRPSYQQ